MAYDRAPNKTSLQLWLHVSKQVKGKRPFIHTKPNHQSELQNASRLKKNFISVLMQHSTYNSLRIGIVHGLIVHEGFLLEGGTWTWMVVLLLVVVVMMRRRDMMWGWHFHGIWLLGLIIRKGHDPTTGPTPATSTATIGVIVSVMEVDRLWALGLRLRGCRGWGSVSRSPTTATTFTFSIPSSTRVGIVFWNQSINQS